MKDLALPTPPAPRPAGDDTLSGHPSPFTDDESATSAFVAELRAAVLERMTPAGMVPDRVTVFVVDELLADALVSIDLALLRQAELDASGELTDEDRAVRQ